MRFYKTLNTVALAGALLLAATDVKAMDAGDKEPLLPGLPSVISIRILAHASGDSETNVGPLAVKYRLVCRNWRNTVDRESRTTIIGLLEKKSPLLRFKEHLLHVVGWHIDGHEEGGPVSEARIENICSAVTTKSPLKLIRITAIWGDPCLRPKGFKGPDELLFGLVNLKSRHTIPIRAKVAP